MKRLLAASLVTLLIAAPGGAFAWGGSGHRMIGVAAMQALPVALPAFLRTPQAIADVGELSREPDRGKGAGRAYDFDRDPAHFVDLNDDGSILGGPKITALPPTRAEYEKALAAVGQDNWKAGYLPYAIIDRYQQLAKFFAMWRALEAAEANPAWAQHKAWFTQDRRRREGQILVAIGELSHFVGDGSQPLHVSIHFNGWGDFPNPGGYTSAKVHYPFEADFVRANVTVADVAANLSPPNGLSGPIEQHVGAYLAATGAQVAPFYEMEKAGGLKPGDARGKAFAVRQLGAGASELRDLISQAWQTSSGLQIGYRPIPLADVLSGKTDPYAALSGVD